MTSDEEKSKNEKMLRSPIKNSGNDNNGFDQSEDEWSNDVIMEIGRKVWNQPNQEYEDKETKKTKNDDRNISRSSNININPEAIYNSFGWKRTMNFKWKYRFCIEAVYLWNMINILRRSRVNYKMNNDVCDK